MYTHVLREFFGEEYAQVENRRLPVNKEQPVNFVDFSVLVHEEKSGGLTKLLVPDAQFTPKHSPAALKATLKSIKGLLPCMVKLYNRRVEMCITESLAPNTMEVTLKGGLTKGIINALICSVYCASQVAHQFGKRTK